jgi:hypothetical protein
MPFTIARPWKDKKTGTLHLRQRTPRDLISLKGTVVALPLGMRMRTVKIGEVVQMSLHTRDISEAKRLHAIADAALKGFWEARRAGGRVRSTYTPDPALDGLCGWMPLLPTVTPPSQDHPVTMEALLERWLAYYADKKAKNTLKRYKASLRSLAAFTGRRDIRSITGDDLHA